MGMKRFRRIAVAAGIVAIALFPQTAAANAPTRFPSQPLVGTFDAGLLCPFAVFTTPVPVTRTQTQTLYFDKSGNIVRVTFTGSLYVLLQNAGTGKSVVLNASGAGTDYIQPDGSAIGQGSGPGLVGLFPTDQGGPALLYVVGRETFNVSPTGRITNLSIVGTVTDLCAVLAG